MNKEVLTSCDTVFTLYKTPKKFCFVFIYVLWSIKHIYAQRNRYNM